MERIYDLYGFSNSELGAVRILVERILEIKFEAHESSYHGGMYYRMGKTGEENFMLKKNYDPYEEEWAEEDFADIKVLLYVNRTHRAEQFERALTKYLGGKLLRREEL